MRGSFAYRADLEWFSNISKSHVMREKTNVAVRTSVPAGCYRCPYSYSDCSMIAVCIAILMSGAKLRRCPGGEYLATSLQRGEVYHLPDLLSRVLWMCSPAEISAASIKSEPTLVPARSFQGRVHAKNMNEEECQLGHGRAVSFHQAIHPQPAQSRSLC